VLWAQRQLPVAIVEGVNLRQPLAAGFADVELGVLYDGRLDEAVAVPLDNAAEARFEAALGSPLGGQAIMDAARALDRSGRLRAL
jgi:hypothetical protein